MFNPYATKYGKLLNTRKLEEALSAYLTTNDLDLLEYEYPMTGDVRCAYITGYTQEEQELPVWEHPLVVKTLKGVSVVVSDIRKYVTKLEEQPAKLGDVTRDANGLNFIILRTLLTRDFLDNKIGEHRAIFKPATTAMGAWLSGMINTIIMLDPIEAFRVEIISSVYANTLFYKEDDIADNLDVIIARVIGSKHVYNISKKEIKDVANAYSPTNGKGMDALINNISMAIDDGKSQFITVDSLIGVMGNVWYGPGGSETPIIAIENMPTWLSLLYSVISNRSYQKSRIGNLLNKHKRAIDSKLVDKHFTNYINDIIVK